MIKPTSAAPVTLTSLTTKPAAPPPPPKPIPLTDVFEATSRGRVPSVGQQVPVPSSSALRREANGEARMHLGTGFKGEQVQGYYDRDFTQPNSKNFVIRYWDRRTGAEMSPDLVPPSFKDRFVRALGPDGATAQTRDHDTSLLGPLGPSGHLSQRLSDGSSFEVTDGQTAVLLGQRKGFVGDVIGVFRQGEEPRYLVRVNGAPFVGGAPGGSPFLFKLDAREVPADLRAVRPALTAPIEPAAEAPKTDLRSLQVATQAFEAAVRDANIPPEYQPISVGVPAPRDGSWSPRAGDEDPLHYFQAKVRNPTTGQAELNVYHLGPEGVLTQVSNLDERGFRTQEPKQPAWTARPPTPTTSEQPLESPSTAPVAHTRTPTRLAPGESSPPGTWPVGQWFSMGGIELYRNGQLGSDGLEGKQRWLDSMNKLDAWRGARDFISSADSLTAIPQPDTTRTPFEHEWTKDREWAWSEPATPDKLTQRTALEFNKPGPLALQYTLVRPDPDKSLTQARYEPELSEGRATGRTTVKYEIEGSRYKTFTVTVPHQARQLDEAQRQYLRDLKPQWVEWFNQLAPAAERIPT